MIKRTGCEGDKDDRVCTRTHHRVAQSDINETE